MRVQYLRPKTSDELVWQFGIDRAWEVILACDVAIAEPDLRAL
jgi:hypothetical protein